MTCPKCGGPGGVKLLYSVAPCNRCDVADRERRRVCTGKTNAELGVRVSRYAATMTNAFDVVLAHVEWDAPAPCSILTFDVTTSGIPTWVVVYRDGERIDAFLMTWDASRVSVGQELSCGIPVRVAERLFV